METRTQTERFPPPVIQANPQRMADFTQALRRCGYDLRGCAKRLGVIPWLGVNFWRASRSGWVARHEDPLDTLVDLFIDSNPVPVDRLKTHLSTAFIDSALDMNLLERVGPSLEAKLCLFPCQDHYLATDRAEKNTDLNQVMWLWSESFILGGLVKRTPRRRAIDLGTGSGLHALLASVHSREVVAVDNNPRALAFARFNAALNGRTNIEFALSDMFKEVEGTCDILTANPPYAPDLSTKAGDNFWSGGPTGTELLQRIVEALPERLEMGGVAYLIALYPNPPGTGIRDWFNRWLGEAVDSFEVIDLTWPVPKYKDMMSDQPFQGDRSAWRFGVVSLRRTGSGEGWWSAAEGRPRFFDEEGNCTVVVDHAAWLQK